MTRKNTGNANEHPDGLYMDGTVYGDVSLLEELLEKIMKKIEKINPFHDDAELIFFTCNGSVEVKYGWTNIEKSICYYGFLVN